MSEININDRPDNHDFMSEEHIAGFLRNYGTGVDNLGRQLLGFLIRQYNNPTVLDAACGTCVNWEVFKQNNVQCQYTGMDRTKNMLKEANKRYGDDIELIEGYVQDIPLKDNTRDIVILRHILEHLPDGYEKAIHEGLRVASKELIVVFFLDPSTEPIDNIDESEPDENGCTFFWNTYSWLKFTQFISNLGVQMKVDRIMTPGATHADTIVRIIK